MPRTPFRQVLVEPTLPKKSRMTEPFIRRIKQIRKVSHNKIRFADFSPFSAKYRLHFVHFSEFSSSARTYTHTADSFRSRKFSNANRLWRKRKHILSENRIYSGKLMKTTIHVIVSAWSRCVAANRSAALRNCTFPGVYFCYC